MESHENVSGLEIQVPVPRSFNPQGKPKNIRNIGVPPGSIISHGTTTVGGAYLGTVCGNLVGLVDVPDPGGNVDL